MRPAPSDGPSPRAFLANLGAPLALGNKLRLAARNAWLKLWRRRTCCGHPGEPGC